MLQKRCVLPLICLSLMGCATHNRSSSSEKTGRDDLVQKRTHHRIFFANLESVWRAVQLTLKYPIAINNMDTGVIETEWIQASEGFIPPTAKRDPSSGIRYKLTFNIVKGRTGEKESTRVSIVKRIERLKDFFSEPEVLESDGLEEQVLFYRIERELTIERGIKKSGATATPKEQGSP